MTCPEAEDLLSAFIDHELDEEKMEEMREHIEKCPHCKQTAEELQHMMADLSSLKDVPVPERFNQRLHEALAAEGRQIRASKMPLADGRKKIHWKRIYSLAAVFLVGLFSVILYNNNLDDFNKQDVSYSNQAEKDVQQKGESKDTAEVSDKKAQNASDSLNKAYIPSEKATGNHDSAVEKKAAAASQTEQAAKADRTDLNTEKAGEAQKENVPVQREPIESQPDEGQNTAENPQLFKSITLQAEDKELNGYLEQLHQVLAESCYEVNSCTQNEEGSMWIIEITIITTNSDGQEIKENAVYCGQDGRLWKKES